MTLTAAINLEESDRTAIPHLSEYFGMWSMLERHFQGYWQFAQQLNISMHMQTQQAVAARATGAAGESLTIQDGIAVIGIAGSMMKHQSSFGASSSTALARRKIRAAVRNPGVAGIFMVWETPGGTVAGTHELAEEIAAAGKHKPVWSFADDLCCSAGYWAACQAHKIFANPTASVGSIGVYMVVRDFSGAAEKAGIKVHVISSGGLKGAGTPGIVIPPEFLAEQQGLVNTFNETFVAAVASGRKLSIERARKLADGRVYLADAAKKVGLIDGVQSLESTFDQFRLHVQKQRTSEGG